jgi:hypothetical protein
MGPKWLCAEKSIENPTCKHAKNHNAIEFQFHRSLQPANWCPSFLTFNDTPNIQFPTGLEVSITMNGTPVVSVIPIESAKL